MRKNVSSSLWTWEGRYGWSQKCQNISDQGLDIGQYLSPIVWGPYLLLFEDSKCFRNRPMNFASSAASSGFSAWTSKVAKSRGGHPGGTIDAGVLDAIDIRLEEKLIFCIHPTYPILNTLSAKKALLVTKTRELLEWTKESNILSFYCGPAQLGNKWPL